MEREQSIPSAELVANLGWVQRLALSLARNPDAADDLTQEVARVWLERRPDLADPPQGAYGIRAWLAAVTRRLALDRVRSESARRAREHSVAVPELTGDTYEVVERGAWQKRVTESVMDLPEPYRSTILYCYLDQLTTRVVAERMSVREATVRKRLERGLTMLRLRLGGKANDGSQRWLAGILLMTTKTKLIGLALAIALALLVAWRMHVIWSDVEREEAATTPTLVQPAEHASQEDKQDTAAPDVGPPTAVPSERRAVTAPAEPTTGSLLVHVSWGDDKSPAVGVLVSLSRSGADPLFDDSLGTTNEQGAARFVDLQPGKLYPQVNRGKQTWGGEVTIAAGKQSECSLEVEIGMNCKGIVVDRSNQPIADAEVLVADWGGGLALPLTRTAADGTFAMRSIATHCHIGARAIGHAASTLRKFTAGKGAQVEMRIVLADPSAGLSGVVLDAQGRPVADAVVQAGSSDQGNQTLPDGTQVMLPRPTRVHTDIGGRFEFHNLSPGNVPLAVRARGLSQWKQSVEVKFGQPKSITVQLALGVTVLGSVSDDSGAKVSNATISIGEWGELGRLNAESDGDGSYRLEGVAAGELKLNVESDVHGKAETMLSALAGETVRWDPVLSNGLMLRGLVLDSDGKPVKNAMVEAQLEHGTREVQWFGSEGTDDSGRFTLKSCIADQPLKITVLRKSTFPEIFLQHVIPSAEELVIHLPKEAWVYIQGRILDPEDKALPNVHAMPMTTGGSGTPAESADPKTGEFRYGPYPPGEYQLRLQADGYPAINLPKRTLAADEVWDVGTLRFEKGGTLLMNILTANALPQPHQLEFSILTSGGAYLDRMEVQDGVGRSGLLAPGSYLVQIGGEQFASPTQAFDVRVGAETTLDVQLHSGVGAVIQCALPENETGDGWVQIVITDRTGIVVLRRRAWNQEGTAKLSVCLLPGEYRIEASVDAWRGSASLTLGAGSAAASVPLQLTRK